MAPLHRGAAAPARLGGGGRLDGGRCGSGVVLDHEGQSVEPDPDGAGPSLTEEATTRFELVYEALQASA